MKADLPLSERQRIEAEDQRELRAALLRRHFEVMEGQQLVAAGVLDHNLRVACIAYAVLNRTPVPPVDEPVAAPEAEPPRTVAPLAVVISERARPDNLRERLGLR